MTASVQTIVLKAGGIVAVPCPDLDGTPEAPPAGIDLYLAEFNPGEVLADGWGQIFDRIPGPADATEGTGDGRVIVRCDAKVANGKNNNAVGCGDANTNPQAGGTKWPTPFIHIPAGGALYLGSPENGGLPADAPCVVRLLWERSPTVQ